jgi:hypothetical protein
MLPEKRRELIFQLNEKLKNCKTGDDIREVFFAMIDGHFTHEEINKVFENVEISNEKISEIEENDKIYKR